MDDLRPSRIVHAALRQRESPREPRLERVLSGGLPFYILLPPPIPRPHICPYIYPSQGGGHFYGIGQKISLICRSSGELDR